MYARVVTAQISPDQVDEAIRLWQEFVAPSVKQQPGFNSARLLVERKTGKVRSMGLWQTEADLLWIRPDDRLHIWEEIVPHLFDKK
jgi:quinol monooxygenase YgiN